MPRPVRINAFLARLKSRSRVLWATALVILYSAASIAEDAVVGFINQQEWPGWFSHVPPVIEFVLTQIGPPALVIVGFLALLIGHASWQAGRDVRFQPLPTWSQPETVVQPTVQLAGLAVGSTTNTFSLPGQAFVESGRLRQYFSARSLIIGVRAAVHVAPTGAPSVVDVNKNGMTVFTDQSQRPAIAPGANASAEMVPSVSVAEPGEYVTVDVDQVGSILPGGDLTVMVRSREISAVNDTANDVQRLRDASLSLAAEMFQCLKTASDPIPMTGDRNQIIEAFNSQRLRNQSLYGGRLQNLLEQYLRRGMIDQEEQDMLVWKLSSSHWLVDVASRLEALGRQL